MPETETEERAPLSPERIETAALALIEREGLAGFSIRKLGSALGCTAMSLYHWYPSKGHLMDALIDRVARDLMPLPPPELPWRERVRRAALGWRRMALDRPGFFQFVATHRMNTPTCLVWLEAILALVREGTAERRGGGAALSRRRLLPDRLGARGNGRLFAGPLDSDAGSARGAGAGLSARRRGRALVRPAGPRGDVPGGPRRPARWLVHGGGRVVARLTPRRSRHHRG